MRQTGAPCTCARALIVLLLLLMSTGLFAQNAQMDLGARWFNAIGDNTAQDCDGDEAFNAVIGSEYVFDALLELRAGPLNSETPHVFQAYRKPSGFDNLITPDQAVTESFVFDGTSPETTFDFRTDCAGIDFTSFRHWEHDKNPLYIPDLEGPDENNSGCWDNDDFYQEHTNLSSSLRQYLSSNVPEYQTGNLLPANASGGVQASFFFNYERNSLLTGMVAVDAGGTVIDAAFCEGGEGYWKAQVRPGYTGFKMQWERIYAGINEFGDLERDTTVVAFNSYPATSEDMEFFPDLRSDGSVLRVPVERNVRYRVIAYTAPTACMPMSIDLPVISGLFDVLPAFSDPTNLVYEITPSCGFEPGTGTLEILRLVGVQTTEIIELTLQDTSGASITLPQTTAGAGGIFDGLSPGEYTLFVTVNPDGGGLECLSSLTLFVDVVSIAIASYITFEQPADCNGGGLNAVVEAGLGVTRAGGTDELVYELGVGIPGNGNIVREIRTNNSESVLQEVVFANVEPESDYYVVITNRENGCEPLVSDVFTAPAISTTPMVRSSSRSIECPENNLREILVSVINDNSRNFLYTVDVTTATGTVYQTSMFGADTARLIINDQDITPAELPLTATVISEQLCESVPQSVNFTLTPAPVRVLASVIANPSTCNATNGEISVKIVDGAGPYSLQTSKGDINQITTDSFVVSSLTTGPVFIFGADANGCFGSEQIDLYNEDAIPLTLSVPNEIYTSCAGATDAGFTATSSGGSGTRTYQLQPGPTGFFATNTFTNLGAGLYTVTVMDDGTGCTTSTQVSVLDPDQATVSGLVVNGGFCPDDAYTFTFNLDPPPGFGFIKNVSSDPNCINLTTLRISLDGGATYQTYPSTFFPVLPFGFCASEAFFEIDLMPGDYDIRLQVDEGCGGTIPFTLSAADFVDDELPAITNVSVNQPNCANESGSITVDFTAGVDRNQLVLLRYTTGDNLVEVARSFYLNNNSSANTFTFNNVPVSEIISSADGAHAGGYVVRLETGYFFQQSIGWTRRPVISCDIYSPQEAGPAGTGSFVQYEIAPLNEAPSGSHTWTNPDYSCDGSLAEITLSASGGLPPYEYSFSGGSFSAQTDYITSANNSNETGNGPEITYQVRDANGCLSTLVTTVSEGVLLNELFPPNFTVISPFGSCRDIASVRVETNGGTPPFNVSLFINQSMVEVSVTASVSIINIPRPESFGPFVEPEFSVFGGATDAAGCSSAPVSFSIPNLIAPDVSVASTGVSCPDAADGSIEVAVDASGAPPFMVSGFRSGTVNGVEYFTNPFTANGLGLGEYTVVVEDEQGCRQVFSATVAETNPIVFQPEIANAGPCATDATGSFSVFLSGGSPPYSLSLEGGPAITRMENETASFTDLLAGEYSLLVTDQNGCTTDYPFLVGGPQPFFATLIGQRNPACVGVDDGSLAFDVRGGNKPLRFSLDGGPEQDSAVFVNLAAGTYSTLLVTDASDCIFTYDLGAGAGAVLVNQSNVTATTFVFDVECRGEATGTVTLNGAGGMAPYQHAIGAGAFQPGNTFTGLTAGTYNFTVQDANGCTFNPTGVVVGEPAEALGATVMVNDVACAGETSGSIVISATGGVPGYTYSLNGAAPITASTFNNLGAGTYAIQVIDNLGCTFSLTGLTLAEPTPIAGTLVVESPFCFGGEDGQVAGIPSGGSPPYQYRLFGGPPGTDVFGPDSLFTGLPPGTYAIRWQDANGCESPPLSFSVVDGPPFTIQVDTQTDATCGEDNGSATVSPLQGGVGAITYNWTGGLSGSIQTDLSPGIYTVEATDENGCTATFELTIGEQPSPTITDQIGVNSGCEDNEGQASVVINGGLPPYTFDWSSGNSDSLQTGLSAGRYYVTVTDANLCTVTDSVDVQTFPIFSFSASSTADSCGLTNGTITLGISGGSGSYSVAWEEPVSGSAFVYTGLASGNYSFTITDTGSNCDASGSITVGEVAGPTAAIASVNNSLCTEGNGSVEIASSGNGILSYRWNDGNTDGPVRDQLSSGNYTVTISDITTCEAVLDVIVELEMPPTVAAQVEVDSCSEGRGRIVLMVADGQSDYTFSWDDDAGRTDSIAASLFAGTYSGLVQDANGCSTLFSFEVLSTAPPVFGPVNVTDASCDQFNGSITVTATGGSGNLAYTWDDDFTTSGPRLDDVGAGIYTVTVTDQLGCFAVLPVTVVDIPGPTNLMTSSLENTTCGEDNGAVSLEVTGGSPAYTYTWSHDLSLDGPTASALAAGTYDVTVTDANLCEITASFTIGASLPLSGEVISSAPATCDQRNGSATVSTENATGQVTYAWGVDPEPLGPTATDLPGGTYNVTATDENSCSVIIGVVINNTPAPVLTVVDVADPLCSDGTGSISLSATGGTGTLATSWSHDPELNDLEADGLFAGSYTIILTDATGCTDEVTLVLDPPNPPSFGPVDISSSSCGEANGTITVSVTGGAGTLAYAWDHDASVNGPIATGLLAGTYTISVTDEVGCQDEIIVFVSDVPGPSAIVASSLFSTICGADNGILGVSVTGGMAPFTYAWSHDPMAAGPNLANLPEGEYTVTVTDANGCTINESFTVEGSALPTASIVMVTEATCGEANGEATISTTGLAAPVTYVWGVDPEPNGPVATGLSAGTYSVVATGANGCTAMVTATINTADGPSLEAEVVRDPRCEEGTGSISLTISGGMTPYSFNWSPETPGGGAELTGLNAGDYALTVTDVNGCTLFFATTLAPPNPPALLAPNVQPSTCGRANGSISLMVTGGAGELTYTWSHDASLVGPLAEGLLAGSYTITVTDELNCADEVTVEVMDVSGPMAILALTQVQTRCNEANGSLSVSVTGGTPVYTYAWGHDPLATGAELTELTAGDYVVTVTDANGCTLEATFNIAPSLALELTVAELNNATCDQTDGSATVSVTNANGNVSYTWGLSPVVTGPTATGLQPGFYEVTAEDENGCFALVGLTIGRNEGPTLEVESSLDPVCEEGSGSITVVASGGTEPYTYMWPHDDEVNGSSASGLNSGDYTITVTDGTGCSEFVNIVLAAPNPPSLEMPEVTTTSCGENNGSITLAVMGGNLPLIYFWNHDPGLNGPSAIGLAAGTYEVTVSDALGCSDVQSISVGNANGPEVITAQVLVPTSCGEINGRLTILVNGGSTPYAYSWSHDPAAEGPVLTELSADAYTVTVTDANGCSLEQTFIIESSSSVALALASGVDANCGEANGLVTVAAVGGVEPYTYAWSHDAGLTGPVAENLNAGAYVVTVTDASGCTDELTTNLNATGEIVINESMVSEVDCDGTGGSVFIAIAGGGENLTFSWSHDPDLNAPLAEGLAGGTYAFTVTSPEGCSESSSVLVPGAAGPSGLAVAAQTDASCDEANGSLSISVTGGVLPYTYTWLPDAGSGAEISNLAAGEYALTVTDANGCIVSGSFPVAGTPALSLVNSSTAPATCGEANGTASVEIFGGTGPLTYVWGLNPEPNGPVAGNLLAGTYPVSVTDAAGCSITETITVAGTEAIVIAPTITNASCLGSDGSISLEVTGGTEPYAFAWADTTASAALLAEIPAGTYTVTVTGAAGCSIIQTFDVIGESDDINIFEESRTTPLCAGGANGRLSVFALGGDNTFSYAWSNGNSSAEITGIVAGEYTVTATDGNGCSGALTLTLADGAGTVFEYPTADTTICQDDILAIDLTGDYQSVLVTGDNGYSSSAPVSLIENAGTYTLTVTDFNGCPGAAELVLNVTTEPLTAGMVLPSNIVLGDTMVVLEISFPRPDNVSWVFDDARMQLISQNGNQYRFTFSETGSYELGLVADNGGCNDVISKEVIVHADSSSIAGGPLGRLEIRSATVAPNPNQGEFTLDVQLSASLPLTATLYNIDGLSLERQSLPAATTHQFSFNLTLESGTYLLSVQTASQRRVLTVVVTN